MRENKFRVWNAPDKIMEYSGYCMNMDGSLIVQGAGAVLSNDYVPLRFTGLLDKAGVEIYEGDIVEHKYKIGWSRYEVKFGEYDTMPEDYESYRGYGWWGEHAVSYQYGDFVSKERHTNFLGYPDITEFEVIGNIHENPELIDETKKETV